MAGNKCRSRFATISLFCLMQLLNSVLSTSKTCITTYDEDKTIANCSGLHFTIIPWDLHHQTHVLDMSSNQLTEIGGNAFIKYKYLVELILQNNSIKSIHIDAFANLKHLSFIDLSRNLLIDVPSQALKNMPNLYRLSLSGNKISVIDSDAFENVPSLKVLHLEGNHIHYVAQDAFVKLNESLQTLDLQNNALRKLDKGVLEYNGHNLMTIRLYNNPWFCDCKIRWLKEWLINMTEYNNLRWEFPRKKTTCDGPSVVRQKPFTNVPLNTFACEVEMYTSGSNLEVQPGDPVDMFCKFSSIPESSAFWFKGNKQIQFETDNEKYKLTETGTFQKDSKLKIFNFQYEDIATYRCLVQNIRGSSSISFVVTLEGVDPNSVTPSSLATKAKGAQVETRSIIIAVSVIGGILLILGIVGLIICFTGRWKQRQEKEKQAIALEVKKHFITNGDISIKSMDNINENDSNSNNDSNNHEKNSDPEETGLLHNTSLSNIYQHPSSPNGNTYVSFGSELTEPEDLNQFFTAVMNSRQEGSHTESTTPLLDYYTPCVFDSDDPLDDSTRMHSLSHVPRHGTNYYWSNNHIPRTPGSTRSTQIYRDPYTYPYRDYRDYRDNRYPYYTPPMHRVLPTKKSASVGNLGLVPPRKPPRSYKSGEQFQGSIDDTNSEIERTLQHAQRPSYLGLTPGTPV